VNVIKAWWTQKAESVEQEVNGELEEDKGNAFVWLANPASAFCVEQWWENYVVKDAEWNEIWLCKLTDGTVIDEWEYYRKMNDTAKADTEVSNPLYSDEDLKSAQDVIINDGFGSLSVKVENVKIEYMWDEKANSELDYCKSLDSGVEECAVFESEFYIPEQDAAMAWAFEPNTTLTGYQWVLGRTKGWAWKILSFGY